MNAIEIMALIVALLTIIKILTIVWKPKAWMDNVVKKVHINSGVSLVAGIIIAGISLYYLLQSMTIIHIFAVLLFFAGLMLITVSSYTKEIVGLADKLLKDKNSIKKAWLSLLIWLILAVWVLYVLFG